MTEPVARFRTERLLFFLRALASPRHLGSVTPSSRFLACSLLDMVDVPAASSVVELGPGTGPITRELLARMSPAARLLCIERDPDFVDFLRRRFPDPRLTIVNGSAEQLVKIIRDHGLASPDLVVSGLPFSSLPISVRDTIFAAIRQSLAPGGHFVLYQYSLAMQRRLRGVFPRVRTRWEVRNVPPAACVCCATV